MLVKELSASAPNFQKESKALEKLHLEEYSFNIERMQSELAKSTLQNQELTLIENEKNNFKE